MPQGYIRYSRILQDPPKFVPARVASPVEAHGQPMGSADRGGAKGGVTGVTVVGVEVTTPQRPLPSRAYLEQHAHTCASRCPAGRVSPPGGASQTLPYAAPPPTESAEMSLPAARAVARDGGPVLSRVAAAALSDGGNATAARDLDSLGRSGAGGVAEGTAGGGDGSHQHHNGSGLFTTAADGGTGTAAGTGAAADIAPRGGGTRRRGHRRATTDPDAGELATKLRQNLAEISREITAQLDRNIGFEVRARVPCRLTRHARPLHRTVASKRCIEASHRSVGSKRCIERCIEPCHLALRTAVSSDRYTGPFQRTVPPGAMDRYSKFLNPAVALGAL